jgi:hypothetical protein
MSVTVLSVHHPPCERRPHATQRRNMALLTQATE